MNKGILKRYSLGALCLMCLLASCSEEQPTDKPTLPTGKPVEMRLQVNAPLGSSVVGNETAINRLRMVAFGSIGAPDAGRLVLNKYYPTPPVGNSLKEIITSGRRDIYLIVNEPLSGGGEELDGYKKITTVADMRKLSLVYQGANSVEIYTPTEIPMLVEHLNQLIEVDALNEVGGQVERTMAKVTLNLNVKNTNFPASKQVIIDHIIVKNLPESSSLIAQSYTGALVASEKQNVGVVAAVGDYNFSSTNTFYVPEYLFDNPAQWAYAEIAAHINGEPDRVTKYSVKLGDAMDADKTYGNRYHITRNRHYTFTGDVKSYGEMGDVVAAVTVKVAPWNTVSMDEEVGRYIAFTKATDSGGRVIADGGNLQALETTLKVECSTNIGGWYTVTRDVKGVIVHQSAATASVSAVTRQEVRVTIPQIGTVSYSGGYTVSIYHPTIAQEVVGPVRALNFTQHGEGFIPNWVLRAAGWPIGKLPLNGLQVAKRGNKVPPSGVAENNDPTNIRWKTSEISTPGTAAGLGMGVSSTAAMTGALHPAAEYCREMGLEWFLPSSDELLLIFANRDILGTSYSFVDGTYWSATDYYTDARQACTAYVNGGNVAGFNFKRNGYGVRCARLL